MIKAMDQRREDMFSSGTVTKGKVELSNGKAQRSLATDLNSVDLISDGTVLNRIDQQWISQETHGYEKGD